ncbi:diguanylate cyclase [Halanaerobium hydrogeniformans]|uniref:Diguanylate cyclase and metal dependent phosphohydrolase n=1 Tax=Halanaerobium hydrogeniformans TaxID=656519 RepID=E4RNP4_HALHG|nr:diguanylate cyclase [Halanaerobium hydrogeniformans]ADQ13722.1 diguanylate cyclase and metal dependent phosphohydrolase [Halanaerobium hydrogeniformans]
MKTKVFLKEEQEFKEVMITDPAKPEIKDEFLSKWQNLINIAANIIGVSAALIMKINQGSMEVFLNSQNKDTPYKAGGSYSLGHGLYCETVIAKNKELYIKNALEDETWKDNPDINLNMISYYGLPLNWPDGKSFGTICILDDKSMDLNQDNRQLLKEFRSVIEADFSLLIKQQELKIKNKAIENSLAGIAFSNMQGEIFYVNDSFLKLFGHKTPEEIYDAKITPLDLIPETEFDKIKKAIEITIEKGKWKGESKALKKSGEQIHIQISASLVKDDNGHEICMMASFEDITERKEQEINLKKQKDKLNFIIKGTDAGTWEWNVQTGEIICNEKYEEILGYELEKLKPITIETWIELTHPEDLKKVEQLLKDHFKGEITQYDLDIRMKHKKGHWVWLNARGRLISLTDTGEPYKMFGVHIDISKQKKHEQIIKELHKVAIEFQNLDNEKEICQKTIETARDILDFDLSHISLVKDQKFIPAVVTEGMKPEILSLDYGVIGKAFKNNKSYLVLDAEENPDAKPTDKTYRSAIAVPIKDIGVFLAISTNKNGFNQKDLELAEILISNTKAALDKLYYQKELEYKSFHDSLTNLYNRRFFEEEIKRLDTKRQLPISIIMADLNGLKLINDSYGHDVGDELLKKIAKILESSIRKEDIAARQGGDEFAILLPKTNREQLSKIIKRIKDKVERINHQADIPISIALGSAIKEDSAEDINEILKKADDNMYQNKLSESRSTKSRIVQGLLNSLNAKSNETKEHALRMRDLAVKFGNKLKLTYSEINRLSLLATMHDIGKTTISEEILTKAAKLDEKEWMIMKKHSEQGYKIASASEEFILVAEDILAHHEHWDGSGYPRGLSGEEIPYLARIISIVDAYDVMTNDRPYSKAISMEEALKEIKSCAGSQFDPELADKFIEMMNNEF